MNLLNSRADLDALTGDALAAALTQLNATRAYGGAGLARFGFANDAAFDAYAAAADLSLAKPAPWTPPPAPEPTAAEQARQAAASVFQSLSTGQQALWEPVRAAVDAALAKGDFARAKDIIATTPAIYADAEEDRAKFLALCV